MFSADWLTGPSAGGRRSSLDPPWHMSIAAVFRVQDEALIDVSVSLRYFCLAWRSIRDIHTLSTGLLKSTYRLHFRSNAKTTLLRAGLHNLPLLLVPLTCSV